MELGVSGLASGFDWLTLVDQLADAERVPQTRLRIEQQDLLDRKSAYGSLVTELGVLQNRVEAIRSETLFQSRETSVSDETVARASVAAGAAEGSHTFEFVQLATAAKRVGQASVSEPLSSSAVVSGVVLADAAFATAVTGGTFTVNGHQVAISTSDTLQDVFDKIEIATDGDVNASYDPETDSITLQGAGEIVLGSAVDTSNFLQAARLNNNGTSQITSVGELGGVRMASVLSESNLGVEVSDGGAGAGKFRINGVEIAFTETDSTADVLKRINSSGAGVVASYDALSDRFTLTSKVTGDLGMALEDVTGNFLAATGLASGSLHRGKDLIYTIDGGGTLTSHSNTITESSSGVAGLTVTALREGGTAVVEVKSDVESMTQTIGALIEQYNKVQSVIDTLTAVNLNADGTVGAAVLSNESEVSEIARDLRRLVFSPLAGLQETINHLQDLGYDTGSEDNSLSLKDAAALAGALSDNSSVVQELFNGGTSGIAVQLEEYLERLVGDDGRLLAKQDTLTRQATAIDGQVADLERIVVANRQQMISSFIAMEEAQAKVNQQLEFLNQQLGLG